MVHALSQSIKKCFLIVINVALFMTPVHLSEKKLTYLNHPVIDHSSGQEVIELHIYKLFMFELLHSSPNTGSYLFSEFDL